MKEPKDPEPAAGSLTSEYDPNVEPHPPNAADGSVRVLLSVETPPLRPEAARAFGTAAHELNRTFVGEARPALCAVAKTRLSEDGDPA